jgi:hypothetical protein
VQYLGWEGFFIPLLGLVAQAQLFPAIRRGLQACFPYLPDWVKGFCVHVLPDRTQQEMKLKFDPIFKARGKAKKRVRGAFCRPAVFGETIITVVNGKRVVDDYTVDMPDMMVVRDDNVWREQRAMPRAKFERSFLTELNTDGKPGEPITDDKHDSVACGLCKEGCRYYRSKRRVLTYTLTAEDLAWFPTGHFTTSWGKRSGKMEVGTILATGFPIEKEGIDIYEMPSHGLEMFVAIQFYTQGKMLEKFGDKLKSSSKFATDDATWYQAREGRLGERILNADGKVQHVEDDQSLVVRDRSKDQMLHVLQKEQWAAFFDETKTPQEVKKSPSLEEQGYKLWKSRAVKVHEVTKDDLDRGTEFWFKAGKVWAREEQFHVEEGCMLGMVDPSPTDEIFVVPKESFRRGHAF